MGIYIYGVSSKNRKIKGFDTPVYNIDFLGKDSFGMTANRSFERKCGRYDEKDSMKGKLVAFDILGEDQETIVIVYKYQREYNTFNDGGDMTQFLEIAGYAAKRGKRYHQCTKAYYDIVQKAEDDAKWTKVI